MLRFCGSMSPKNPGFPQSQSRPRVGIPWRTREEERQANTEKLNFYFEAVRQAGGEPEHVSLALSDEDLTNIPSRGTPRPRRWMQIATGPTARFWSTRSQRTSRCWRFATAARS
jgi:hypothetical protein